MSNKDSNSMPISDLSKRVEVLLETTLKDLGIPSRPAILDRIHVEMDKADPDLNLLGRIVSEDVALAGGVISIANSPYFGFHGRVRSVNDALMVLGLDVSCRAIAGLVLRKLFPATPGLERFWDASSKIAKLSGWLAQHEFINIKINASDAYTYGLFRDVGIAILLNRFPFYHKVLMQANDEEVAKFTEIEDEYCPSNHALIGGFLAQSWWLPEEINTAIRLHHEYSLLKNDDDTLLPQSTRGLIAVAQFAEHLLQHHTNLSKTKEWDKSKDVCLALLGVETDQLEIFYQESTEIINKQN